MIRSREQERWTLMRVWADESRRGIVVGPLRELERIRLAANVNTVLREELDAADAEDNALEMAQAEQPKGPSRVPRPRRRSKAEQHAFADAEGALEEDQWRRLLHGLAMARQRSFSNRCQANYLHGGSGGMRDGSERDVIALAVVMDSLVVMGARRPRLEMWKRKEWMHPEDAWPEVGAWSRLSSGELGAPLRNRLDAWASTDAEDRIVMDWNTARAVAFELFGRPFDVSEEQRGR